MASILLDTNIVIPLVDRDSSCFPAGIRSLFDQPHRFAVSVVSLWEIAIKVRIGKLPLLLELEQVPGHLENMGANLIDLRHHHVLHELGMPETKDPFDGLLLAICDVEGMRLLTMDRVLAQHPLAWPAPA